MGIAYCEDLLTELELVIKNGNVTTLFQPIVSLKDGEILGYEALSRGPKNSIFYDPRNLFEYAKTYNLLWELELVCRMKAIEKASSKLNDKKLFINIDPDIIQDKKFTKGFTKELLSKYKLNTDDIIFEITENTAIKDYKQLRNVLDSYAHQGYKIALDDTGSGYSGLIMLAESHPNYIKIDMELIRDIDKNKFKQDIINTFRNLSVNTNIQIIAEGIETENELKTLIDLGVQYGQGYLIQKPEEDVRTIINGKVIKMINTYNVRNKILEEGSIDDFCVGFLARTDKAVDITTNIEQINEIFSEKYTLQGIPVVKDEIPVGIIMRNKFYYQLLKKGIVNLKNYTVETIMTKLPLIVDYYAPIKKVAKLAISRREECTYDYIIVSKDGKYLGVVPIASLLEALAKNNN